MPVLEIEQFSARKAVYVGWWEWFVNLFSAPL